MREKADLLRGPTVQPGPTRPVTRFVVTLLTALLTIAWFSVASTPANASSAVRVSSTEASFASLINADRRAHGLKPLRVVSDLTLVARSWSTAMAKAGDISHNPRLTRQVGAWRAVGENVGMGGAARQLHAAFMASPEHRANILSANYTELGIGLARHNGVLYVTEDFRRPQRAVSATVMPPLSRRVITSAVVSAPVAPIAVVPAQTQAVDPALVAEVARLSAQPAQGGGDPVASALAFVDRMRGLTS
jgi:uncharacterized protein YkwD